jgi:hypothetical protein
MNWNRRNIVWAAALVLLAGQLSAGGPFNVKE